MRYCIFFVLIFASCSSVRNSTTEGQYRFNFSKDDYTFTQQLVGEAETVRIFGIDFSRLFSSKSAKISRSSGTAPIVGGFILDRTDLYAAYNLLEKNPGYDIVMHPNFERKRVRFPLVFSVTTVKVKARLGKMN